MKAAVSVILILVGLGVGFAGGYFFKNYQISRARSALGTNGNFQRFTGTRTGQNGAARGGAVNGTILSMDAKSMTVKMSDGSTKIVLFSGLTTYSNTATASQTDLKTGSTVAVFGTPNSDGSVTASNVQINPISFRPQGSPSPTP